MSQFRTRAALVAAVATVGAATLPGAANAAVTSTVNNITLRIAGDPANDTITLAVAAGGEISVNGAAVAGTSSNGSFDIVIDGDAGKDTINASALLSTQYRSLTVNGGDGDDFITGGAGKDTLNGDKDNDRIVGFRGDDAMNGGEGNDALVWNNGDGTDTANGDTGADEVENNLAPTQNDGVVIKPLNGKVRLDRETVDGQPNGKFGMDISAEKVTVNGLGGDDEVVAQPGLNGLTSLLYNGGTGDDHLVGSDGADELRGGDGADLLDGGGGNDVISGDRGTDTMNGGAGDDALFWFNGDGSDVTNGDAGTDVTDIEGAGGDDVMTLKPSGARTLFNRTSLVPFSVDMDTEAVQINPRGGNDSLQVASGVGALASVGVDAGPGDDQIAGGDEADTLLGGSGDDRLDGGRGADLVDGGVGNDRLLARDGTGDLVRGGGGTDAAQTDAKAVDAVDGVELLDARKGRPAKATIGKLKIVRRHGALVARLPVTCPAGGTCKVTLTLAKPIKVGGVKVVAVLTTKKVTLKGGRKSTVSIKLPKGAAKLASKGHVATKATVISASPDGEAASTRSLAPAVPKG